MSLPAGAAKPIEDVGHILLSVQKEMEKVRSSLDALPTSSSSNFDALRVVLEKAEGNLREKAEVVLKTVVDNSIRTLPPAGSRAQPTPDASSAGATSNVEGASSSQYPSRSGTAFARSGAQTPAAPISAAGMLTSVRSTPRAASAAHSLKPRTARDQMLDDWERQVIVDPQRAAHARRVLDERFLLAIASQGAPPSDGANLTLAGTGAAFPLLVPEAAATISSSPIVAALEPTYVPSAPSQAPRASQALLQRGREHHQIMSTRARALPKANRIDPFEPLPPLTPADAQRGIFNLVTAGLVDPHTDLTPALGPGTGLVRSTPIIFHQFSEQHMRSAAHIAPYVLGANTTKLEIQRLGALGLPTEPPSKEKESKYAGGHEVAPSASVVEQIQLNRAVESQKEQAAKHQERIEQQQQAAAAASIDEHMKPNAPAAPSSLPSLPADENSIAAARGFDELLDVYSLHHFMIRKGATMVATPEFVSYRRTHAPSWAAIKVLITALEQHLSRVNALLAVVDGIRLAELAAAFDMHNTGSTFAQPKLADLMSCLVNRDAVAPLFAARLSKYTGPNGKNLAAAKIQATWKMFVCRKYYKFDRKRFVAARIVQRSWRMYTRHQKTRRLIATAWAAKLQGWRQMMSDFRRRWPRVVRRRRVIVHIPSLSYTCAQRESMHKFTTHENSQFSRMCDLADPLVDLVYVSPVPISDETKNYYMKLLEVSGIKNAESRIKFLVPENAHYFHDHMSLAQKVYYSPKCMRRILQFIRKRDAYIMPNQVGPEDLLLAVHLHLPLLAAEPETGAIFSSKSGAKRIFEAASLNIPPGLHDIWSEDDFYNGLSKLIVRHLDVQRWIFKIDDEFGGRGAAWFEPAELKIYEQLLQERQSMHWDAPETRALTLERVKRALLRTLPAKVQFASPTLYEGNFAQYMSTVTVAGACIEACPPSVTGSPSVNLFIEPDGTCTVVSTHDQIFARPYVYAGALFPQQSVPPEAINALGASVGKACFAQGIIGNVGIDLVTVYDAAHDAQRLFAVDLNLRVTDTAAAFQLFDFLIQGRNRSDGSYMVEAPLSGDAARTGYSQLVAQKRCYAVVNYIFQPHLASIQYRAFFHLCRLKGVAFDLQHREGSAFILNDSLAGGTLGVMCVADQSLKALTLLSKALDFLQEQVGSLPVDDHPYAHEVNLHDIYVAIKTIVRAQSGE